MAAIGRAGANPVNTIQIDAPGFDEVADQLRLVLAGIRHGSVTLIVQDGRVIQIDATQKLRLSSRERAPVD